MTKTDTGWTIHTKESAPKQAQALLEKVEKMLGRPSNFFGVMAESPAALEAYWTVAGLLAGKTGFSVLENSVILQTISRENGCHYCLTSHGRFTVKSGQVPEEFDNKLQAGESLDDPKLEALRVFTEKLVRQRGQVAEQEVSAFLDAGYARADILGVLLAVSLKTLSNYANHITKTPLDE